MPNYRTHSTINLLIALPLLAIVTIFLLHPPVALIVTGAACFAYGTLFMHPDVDLAHQIRLVSVRGVLSIPFRTYSMVFRHRGISHSLIFGTLTRLLWLGLYGIAIFYVAYQVVPSISSFMSFFHRYQPYLITGFLGFFLADLSHLLVDKISSR